MKKLVGSIELNTYGTIDSKLYKFVCPNCSKDFDLVIEPLYNGAFRLELFEKVSAQDSSC